MYSLAIHLNASIEIVITNHADVTLIEVACGYFRTEFDPIASYRIVMRMSLYEIFVLDPLVKCLDVVFHVFSRGSIHCFQHLSSAPQVSYLSSNSRDNSAVLW